MSQAALFPAESFELPHTLDSTGFDIGWDHAHHGLVPPAEHLLPQHPVRQGWEAGRATFRSRTLRATPAVRQWLQLRLHAWMQGQSFERLQVTPNFLQQLAAARCPVTHEPLGDDAVVVRLFDGAGYAAGNLALLSPRAAAQAQLSWSDALAQADRLERGEIAEADALPLNAAEWKRLGVLLSFATPLKHAQVAGLPLTVLPPNRVRVLNAVQALQTMLTLQFTQSAFARHIADLAAVMPSSAARSAFQLFMHTMLARRVAAGPLTQGPALKQALVQAWEQELVQRRWQRLALQLSEADCERIVRYASRLEMAGSECRWLPDDAAVEGWGLETGGQRLAQRAPTSGSSIASMFLAGHQKPSTKASSDAAINNTARRASSRSTPGSTPAC
jgi:hypothetical protein